MVKEGDLLWTPSPERIERSNVTAFMRWLETERGKKFASYQELWQWSVDDLDGFWAAIWDYFKVDASTPYEKVLGKRSMPGAEWFPGARLNYAQHALRYERPNADAIVYFSEREGLRTMSWEELGSKVRTLATQFRSMGIKPGDRVVAYLPNIPEAVIAMLATTSIGAIWSSCGPDFGVRGVLDRYSQLSPKVLICVDGYQYGGKSFDRKPEVVKILGQLDSIETVIYLPYLNREDREPFPKPTVFWDSLFDRPPVPASEFEYEQVPFGNPLWILFSSGTTGLPKAIVHSHGGILLEQLKALAFQMDMKPGQRLFFYTTTGWMMWNFLASSLVADVTPVLYDGHPTFPQPDVLWKTVQDARVTLFGASPTYVSLLQKAGVEPAKHYDLSHLQSIMLAGSPVTPECMEWFYKHVKEDLWVQNGSGGTDICSAFVGGVPILPVYAGEIQGRLLGVDTHAFNANGEVVINEVGEMVVRKPIPSMPVFLWNDPNNERYIESYFQDFPGVWRQGDFFRTNERGGSYVLGRSDATLNRHGVRIGTAEIYRVLALLEEVEDALIVNLDLPGGKFFMPLFVKLRQGFELNDAIREKIRQRLRQEYSPRHVPDKIYQVPDIPYTLTGKKMEVPVRRILSGVPPEKVANRDAVANPRALDFFIEYAATQNDYSMKAS